MYKDEFMKYLLNGANPEEMMTALQTAIEEAKAQEREREIKARKHELIQTIADAIAEYGRLTGVEDIPNLTSEEVDEFEKAFEKEFGMLSAALLGVPAHKTVEFKLDVDDLALENFLKSLS